MKPFADKLLELREAVGWTQAELGEKVGVSRNAIIDYEAGRALPRRSTLKRLAEALKVSADGLVGAPARTDARPDHGAATVAAAENILLREHIADLKADKARLVRENEDLRKKSTGDPDQPASTSPITPKVQPTGTATRATARAAERKAATGYQFGGGRRSWIDAK